MPQPLLLSKGVVVKGDGTGAQYQVTRRLGEGQFAECWEVKQCDAGSDLRFALKLEKVHDRKSVMHEHRVLQKLSSADQVVKVVDSGFHGKHFFYVMELLGDTLFDIRKQAGGRLDLPTVKAVGLSTLAAIEGLHQLGFIHRDIKPANYVLSPPNASASRGKWVLIDFGLVRRFIDEHDGSHLPARPDASFRGSTAYASVHAHRNEDLSRRDDLWSWFYVLLELVEGCLLWRVERDDVARDHAVEKQWILAEKEKGMEQPERLAKSKLPDALLSISAHLKSLSFTDTPDYDHLRTCLQQLPDPQQVQLQLQHLIPQQAWQQQQQNGQDQQQQQQQEYQQQPWNSSPLCQLEDPSQQQQQQQQQRLSPADSLGAAAGAKRQRGSAAADTDLPSKRSRADGSSALKQSWSQQQPGSKLVQHGSSSSPCDAHDDSRAGSLGAPPRAASKGLLANAGSSEQHQPAAAQQANGIGQLATTTAARQRSSSAGGAADANALRKNSSAAAAAVASRGGRASEISDLLTVFEREAPEASKAAAHQAVAGLCALGPLEAVCAISMTLERLVQQSHTSCLPAVSQLLLDLAAFAAKGASEAAAGGSSSSRVAAAAAAAAAGGSGNSHHQAAAAANKAAVRPSS